MSSKTQNNHIIPKHHLKNFQNDNGCIFTFPNPDERKHTDIPCRGKGGGRKPKNTGFKRGYYSDYIERLLGQKYENYGSKVAQKIIDSEAISNHERNIFVSYLTSFIFRVPASKKYLQEILVKVLEEMTSLDYFLKMRNNPRIDVFDDLKYFSRLNDYANGNEKMQQIKKAFEAGIENEHHRICKIFLDRKWWIAESVGNEYFVSSNNPLFYSRQSGLRDEDIQVTFPLSKKMALVIDSDPLTPQGENIPHYFAGKLYKNQVDLINHCTANGATLLYSPKNDQYVQNLLDHPIKNFNRINRGIQKA